MNPWPADVEFGMPTRFEKGRHAIIPAHIRRETERRREAAQHPSPAAIHEAAHEHIAQLRGHENVRAFVRNAEQGVTYYNATPSYTRTESGRRHFNVRATIRRKAAASMAGWIAEALLERKDPPDVDTLMRAEWTERENPCLPLLAVAAKHETDGDSDRAARLVGELLEEARAETIFDLRRAWSQIVKRARELDRKAAA